VEEDDNNSDGNKPDAAEVELPSRPIYPIKAKALTEELAGMVSEERLREIIDNLLKTVDVYNDPYNPDLYWDEWTGKNVNVFAPHLRPPF
jgi:hypothetical protein